MTNAEASRWMGEARGIMATGTTAHVLEYANRLRGLEEFGMYSSIQQIEELASELEKAEAVRKTASMKLHAAAEKLLDRACENWSSNEVIVALFGKRE